VAGAISPALLDTSILIADAAAIALEPDQLAGGGCGQVVTSHPLMPTPRR
jgi:hypothetical protein